MRRRYDPAKALLQHKALWQHKAAAAVKHNLL
jgi:hypothetical protein